MQSSSLTAPLEPVSITSNPSSDHIRTCDSLLGLETASRAPSIRLVPPSCSTSPAISLPRSPNPGGHVYVVLTPPTPLLLDDTQTLHEGAAEVSQTVQKLTLRKRTTSPYQIKLPYMTDRLRAKKGTHSTLSETRHPAHEGTPTSRGTEAQVVANACTSACAGAGIPFSTSHRPAFLSARLPQGTLADATGNPDPKVISKPIGSSPGPIARPCAGELELPRIHATASMLPTQDTWGEINEELCREMEVFTVLSAVAPSHFFAFEETPTGPSLPPASRTPSAPRAWRSSGEPGSTTRGGPWSSFVFPVVVA
ncbi:hypothetical protein C8Q78DRAFT_476473 [Trametes maxima]|nr:hypothetical protein C8Q78DRAFT_476473 [Trametes maxima]